MSLTLEHLNKYTIVKEKFPKNIIWKSNFHNLYITLKTLESFIFLQLAKFFPSLTFSLSGVEGFSAYTFSGLIYPVLAVVSTLSVCRFESLVDIAGADFPALNARSFLYYPLLSHYYVNRFSISTLFEDVEWVPSVFLVFPSSNWAERENWDMFGIMFFNHPDLRRLLSDYGFKGHPLRKEFPVIGFLEVMYSSVFEYIKYGPVSVALLMRGHGYSNDGSLGTG